MRFDLFPLPTRRNDEYRRATSVASRRTRSMPGRIGPGAGKASHQGFTLLEMTVVLTLVAILAAFAITGVQNQVRKVRRADAMQALMGVQLAQEQWRADHATYADTLGTGGLNLRERSEAGYYRLQLSADSGEAPRDAGFRYTVIAHAIGQQAADRACARIALVIDGARTLVRSGPAGSGPLSADSARCWPQ